MYSVENSLTSYLWWCDLKISVEKQMSWNEPEDDAKKKDPWSGKGRRGSNQAPPDLDEVVKNISNRLDRKSVV